MWQSKTIKFQAESLDLKNCPILVGLVNMFDGGLLIIDMDLKVKFANDFYLNNFKKKREDVIGHNVYEAVEYFFERKNIDDLIELTNQKGLAQAEFHLENKFKEKVDVYIYPFFNMAEELIGYVVMGREARNISDLIFRDFKADVFIRHIFDVMHEGATVVDSSGKLQYANQRFYEMLGYPPKELIGKHWTYWCDRDYLERKNYRWMIKNGWVENGVYKYSLNLLKKDRTKLPVLLSVSKNVDRKMNIKSIGVVTDISDRMRLESDFQKMISLNRKILETISTGIITLDKNLRVSSVNNQVEVLFGKKINQVKGLDLRDAFPDIAIMSEWSNWVMRTLRPYHVDRYKLAEPIDQKVMFINVRINPFFESGEEVSGVVCAFDDVSMSAKLEEQIEISYRNLEIAHNKLSLLLKRQTDFLADVSHELRTPLTVISGNVEVALQDKKAKKEDYIEVMQVVENESKRMRGMVEDLTMLTKLESGQTGLQYSQFWVEDLIEDMMKKLKYIDRQGKKVRFTTVENLLVVADLEKVQALLWNLIENGIKYTGDNGLIVVSIYRNKKNKRELMIEVEDNGVGIPEEQIDLVFDRFYRVDKSRSREKGGSGLGLAICMWIAKAHKGNINVRSVLGKKSVFTVSLPILDKKTKD